MFSPYGGLDASLASNKSATSASSVDCSSQHRFGYRISGLLKTRPSQERGLSKLVSSQHPNSRSSAGNKLKAVGSETDKMENNNNDQRELKLSSSGDSKSDDNDEQDEKYPIDTRKQYSCLNAKDLLKESTTYELETFDKHALVIFNQKVVDGEEPRHGTEKDVGSLTRTFNNFGFEVSLHNDLTKDALFEKFKEFSERDFTSYGCVAVAILTHGSDNGLLCAKNQLYREIDAINHFFNKATLVSKPKIFIIQACRGYEASSGVPVLHSDLICKDLDTKHLKPYYFLPLESDLLILHSSYPGRASHRHILDGSWFIQTLCKKIDSLSLTHDLESIMIEVKRAVAIDMQNNVYNETTLKPIINKQMPVMTSTLIRKLYLKKFEERALEECRGLKNKVLEENNKEKSIRHTGSRNKLVDETKKKNTRVGSLFIPTLCTKTSIETEMEKRAMAIDMQNNAYNETTLKPIVNKQMPVMTSTLIRKLDFNKFEERALEECRELRNKVLEETYVEKSIRRTGSRNKFLDEIYVNKDTRFGSLFIPTLCTKTSINTEKRAATINMQNNVNSKNTLKTYVEKSIRRTGSKIISLVKTFVDKSIKHRESKNKVADAFLQLKKHLKRK